MWIVGRAAAAHERALHVVGPVVPHEKRPQRAAAGQRGGPGRPDRRGARGRTGGAAHVKEGGVHGSRRCAVPPHVRTSTYRAASSGPLCDRPWSTTPVPSCAEGGPRASPSRWGALLLRALRVGVRTVRLSCALHRSHAFARGDREVGTAPACIRAGPSRGRSCAGWTRCAAEISHDRDPRARIRMNHTHSIEGRPAKSLCKNRASLPPINEVTYTNVHEYIYFMHCTCRMYCTCGASYFILQILRNTSTVKEKTSGPCRSGSLRTVMEHFPQSIRSVYDGRSHAGIPLLY